MENQKMPDELDNLAKLYEQMLSRVTSEAAVLTLLQEWGKNQRVRAMASREIRQADINKNSAADSAPSLKQLEYLQGLGITEVPKNRKEASRLIDDALAQLSR